MKPIFSKTTPKFLLVAKLSDDRMKLFVDVDPVPEAPEQNAAPAPQAAEQGAAPVEESQTPEPVIKYSQVSRDELSAVLSELLSVDLLNTGVLDDIAKHLSVGEKVEERRIAKGVEPQDGADGRLLFLIKRFTGEGEVQIDDKGFANFRQLRMFDNVSKNMQLARVYPPRNGVEGKDALGKPVPAKAGKPIKLNLDRTLSLKNSERSDEQYQVVVAEAEGYLLDDHGKLTIKTELVVNGNLDYHLGAIDFIGSVRIRGDVLPGFAVKSRSGITVDGSVRDAKLICPHGDIVINGHIFGGSEAQLVSGGAFKCTVAQDLEAEAVGNIEIGKEAMDCELRSQGSVLADKATIAGGRLLSVCGSQAKQFGTEHGRVTHIVLCSDVELTAEYMEIVHNITRHDKAVELIDLHLGPLAKNADRLEKLAGQHREKMKKLLQKKREIEGSRQKLEEKRQAKLRQAHGSKVMRTNILESMYEGVTVTVGDVKFSPPEKITGPVSLDYHPDEKAFKMGELKALECAVSDAGLAAADALSQGAPK